MFKQFLSLILPWAESISPPLFLLLHSTRPTSPLPYPPGPSRAPRPSAAPAAAIGRSEPPDRNRRASPSADAPGPLVSFVRNRPAVSPPRRTAQSPPRPRPRFLSRAHDSTVPESLAGT